MWLHGSTGEPARRVRARADRPAAERWAGVTRLGVRARGPRHPHVHADRPVSWLGQVLGLTSSGVTRLVDRLVAGGWVTRAPGRDARSRQLTLSAAGRDRARVVLRARSEGHGRRRARAVRRGPRRVRALLGLVVRGLTVDADEALRVCGCVTGAPAPRAESAARSLTPTAGRAGWLSRSRPTRSGPDVRRYCAPCCPARR